MKLIIRSLAYILIVVLLIQCEKDEPVIKIDIADTIFLNALIERGIDTNGDGIISTIEAEAVNFLDLFGCDISDMTGIEKFVNLDTLNCEENNLTSLNITGNSKLRILYCRNNPLEELDVSGISSLFMLNCDYCQLNSRSLRSQS